MMESTLLIRADAKRSSGIGHWMRCRALAERWLDGRPVRWVGICDWPRLAADIQELGVEFIPLRPRGELGEDLALVHRHSAAGSWVVLDGYDFDLDYQKSVKQDGRRLLVIDDYRHRNEYSADLLLNQNPGSQDLDYVVSEGCTLLRGPRYALLRRQFSEAPPKKDIPVQATNILVTLGGSDPMRLTSLVLNALAQTESIQTKALLGPEIAGTFSGKTDGRTELVRDRLDLRPLMEWADLAVVAAGSVCMELCHMGVPMLTVVTSPNQEGIATALELEEAAVNLGWPRDDLPLRMTHTVHRLIEDVTVRRRLSARGKALVDGRGTERVVSIMQSFS